MASLTTLPTAALWPDGSHAGVRRLRPNSPEVLDWCEEALADVPERQRHALIVGLGRLRRADDLWQLRASLYGVIAVAHGELVARERLASFDTLVER
jgi:hypothetical protein